MLTGYTGGVRHLPQADRLCIPPKDELFQSHQRDGVRILVSPADSRGRREITHRRKGQPAVELILQDFVPIRSRGHLTSNFKKTGHPSKKWNRATLFFQFPANACWHKPGRNGYPAMVRFSIRGEVEVLLVTRTEQNAIMLGHFNPLLIQSEAERSSVNHDKLVITLDAWTEDAPWGV